MNRSKLNQNSGANSTNLQVHGNLHLGLTYDQAKEVALDVFKSNFYELSERAKFIALQRAEEITESFLKELFKDKELMVEKMDSPAVQSSIFEVQKAYAKTGDKELEHRLIAVLVERIKQEEQTINQLVLDEAINTLPKLTDNEVKLLTFRTCITEIQYPDNRSIKAFESFIKDILLRFYPETLSLTETAHLQYCGCYTLPTQPPNGYLSLQEYYGKRYRGLFTNGFSDEDFISATGGTPFSDFGDLVIKNLRFGDKYQFNVLTESALDDKLTQNNLEHLSTSLKKLWAEGAMSISEVEKLLVEIDSRMTHVIHMYNKTTLPVMRLTPVGNAIAISNYNRVMNTKLSFRAFCETRHTV